MTTHQLAFNEQQPNLERVKGRIAAAIVTFLKAHGNGTFYMIDLLEYVAQRQPNGWVAPDSPGRILRDLKQNKLINYEVVNRKQSLYRVLPLTSTPLPSSTEMGTSTDRLEALTEDPSVQGRGASR